AYIVYPEATSHAAKNATGTTKSFARFIGFSSPSFNPTRGRGPKFPSAGIALGGERGVVRLGRRHRDIDGRFHHAQRPQPAQRVQGVAGGCHPPGEGGGPDHRFAARPPRLPPPGGPPEWYR